MVKIKLENEVLQVVGESCHGAKENLRWLLKNMRPYFEITMQDEPEAVASLALRLNQLQQEQRLVLADREDRLILAKRNQPGSLYETLSGLSEREVSYAQFTQSYEALPFCTDKLEVQRFEFDRKKHEEIAATKRVNIPKEIQFAVADALKEFYPQFDLKQLPELLNLLWLNNENYVRISPAKRTAQAVWMYYLSSQQSGICFDVELSEDDAGRGEYRIMFATENPPQFDFLTQVMEVFSRLRVGVRRAYCLTISNGMTPYFLGTFYVSSAYADLSDSESPLYQNLRSELYNTQILSTSKPTYKTYVNKGLMTGEEASLVNAIIAFCHTNLAHNQPERFSFDDVERTFLSQPEMTNELIKLFELRFDPALAQLKQDRYLEFYAQIKQSIEEYNSGHRYLDDIRRTVFRCALLFINRTLKTNFFVPEKQALAFRLHPEYIDELGADCYADLPADRPYRVTFFFGRHGCGHHIGFSDIARGGWRTVLAHGWDDYISNANTIFRETFVLAHTQHLKNKDIYEGGSKMVVLLDAADLKDRELVTRRLHKVQYGFINAFFDIFITENGKAKDGRVIDYYGQDEPIELGPDENMHDTMVERIATQSVRRGYLLGIGVMSSKRIGINHKEYGVTSAGVVKFAEITMEHLGIDVHRDMFTVKFTGGPGGDVAGNAMHLLLERCPAVRINLIIDGTGALYDPQGADSVALKQILLQQDIEAYDAEALHPGGYILYRNQRKTEGLRELYRKLTCSPKGLSEEWITVDEFYRDFNRLLFTVKADLFIPAGGRPETVDVTNYQDFFDSEDQPSMRAIVEGANSFITPEARDLLQKKGIVILRDSSANKCGVISSSYEIMANLLMSEKEFITNKELYVADVLSILEKRAEDEARLIFKRLQQSGGNKLITEISAEISQEINANYSRLFEFFQANGEASEDPQMKKVLLAHMPKFIRERPRYRGRLQKLPPKYIAAIIASEISSSLVYRGDQKADFIEMIKGHINRNFTANDKKKTVS